MTAKSTDYAITPQAASDLSGAAVLPSEFRRKILALYAKEHGTKKLIELFAEFIGMANSVIANNREMIELYLITECDTYPDTAAQINLPTIFGALQGVILADGVKQDSRLCEGCAFRLGTVANQSPCTTADADWCAKDNNKFMCHEDIPEDGEPKHACAGYARKRRVEAGR